MSDPYPALNVVFSRLLLLLNIKTDDLPTEAYQKVVLEGIVKYHNNWTVAEILLAVEMNVHNRFPAKIEHFGKLTADYISSCLHLYSEARKAAQLKAASKALNDSKADITYPQTPEASYKGAVDYAKVTGELPTVWDWNACYLYMDSKGMVTLTLEEKRDLRSRVEAYMKAETSSTKFCDLVSYRLAKAGNTEDAIKTACRKHIVLEHLKQFINQTA